MHLEEFNFDETYLPLLYTRMLCSSQAAHFHTRGWSCGGDGTSKRHDHKASLFFSVYFLLCWLEFNLFSFNGILLYPSRRSPPLFFGLLAYLNERPCASTAAWLRLAWEKKGKSSALIPKPFLVRPTGDFLQVFLHFGAKSGSVKGRMKNEIFFT